MRGRGRRALLADRCTTRRERIRKSLHSRPEVPDLPDKTWRDLTAVVEVNAGEKDSRVSVQEEPGKRKHEAGWQSALHHHLKPALFERLNRSVWLGRLRAESVDCELCGLTGRHLYV